MMEKKLYRSRDDQMIAGVCAGLAKFLGMDVTIVRLVFALFALAGGPGVLLYFVMWVVVPEEPEFLTDRPVDKVTMNQVDDELPVREEELPFSEEALPYKEEELPFKVN